MRFRSRVSQTTAAPSLLSLLPSHGVAPNDTIFDTDKLPYPIRALNWTLEADVHGGIRVTENLAHSNQFLGVQTSITRDEVRGLTHLVAIENDGLYTYTFNNQKLIGRVNINRKQNRRAHLTLRKFDGELLVAHVAENGGKWSLWLNSTKVETESDDIDFPFLSLKQPPIGFPAVQAPASAALSYKCRASGRIFVVPFDPITLAFGKHTALDIERVVGGLDTAFWREKLVGRAQVVDGDKLKTTLVFSQDSGVTFEPATRLDIKEVPHDSEVASNAPVTIDHTGDLHIPIAVNQGEKTILLDAMPGDDLVVASIETGRSAIFSLQAFPRMPEVVQGFRIGFGDGDTDGNGIIATISTNGHLFVANSQSGGYSYPPAAKLNYDMQQVSGFRSTECYTSGRAANIVSMDYVFVEADDLGRPLSSELWLETWDMPLPEPKVKATFNGGKLRLKIESDGWFYPGQTAFELTPANTEISKVHFIDWREIELEFANPALMSGVKVSFETKNAFYFHRQQVVVF